MKTLVIGSSLKDAERGFEFLGLSEDDGDYACGVGTPLYGMRFENLVFADSIVITRRNWSWFFTELLLRFPPGVDIRNARFL